MDAELEEFKKLIDLRAYAASVGFKMDYGQSSEPNASHGNWIMRRDEVKVNINRKADRFLYFNCHDESDNGSVIDFTMRYGKTGKNYGLVRKELRPWVGRLPSPLPFPASGVPGLTDRASMQAEYARMKPIGWHRYLEGTRCLPLALLTSPRFADRMRVDARGNAVFPHFDPDGVCGFEKKNIDFTGFASGGTKGLWESRDFPGDTRLVFAESAIDALSYAVLFPDGQTRYRSIGGQINPQQPGLITAAIKDLKSGIEVIAAMDADQYGRKLATMVEQAVVAANCPHISFKAHFPADEGTDWNDVLKNRRSSSLPTAPF